MLADLIRGAVETALPPTPMTGGLPGDLRQFLGTIRSQLANPLVGSIAPGLVGEARHSDALAEVLYASVAAPRRAAARGMLQAAINRGELSATLDLELAIDLLIAPLAFRMLVTNGGSDDDYLNALTAMIVSALQVENR